MSKLTGKAKAKARAKAFKAKQANRGAFIVGTNFTTEPWMGVVQDYIVYATSVATLKDIPFDSGNSIQQGKYVIAFDSDATSYADVDKAYLTEYSGNAYLGHIKDLYSNDTFVFDVNRILVTKTPFTLLECVDANGQTATERATWKQTA